MSEKEKKKKVIFCVPFVDRPSKPFIKAIEDSIPLIEEAGFDHGIAQERGNAYISCARSTMLRKALDAKADIIVFLDYDLSWAPPDLLRLIKSDGDVVAGTYRFKNNNEPHEYMARLKTDKMGRPTGRESDGAMEAELVPAGFLKVTDMAINKFAEAYPNLLYGSHHTPHVDLFNHGTHRHVWWGEDYAFCRNWRDAGGQIWLIPNLNITHWAVNVPTQEGGFTDIPFPGNFHEFSMRQPGGLKDPNRGKTIVVPFPALLQPAFSNHEVQEEKKIVSG